MKLYTEEQLVVAIKIARNYPMYDTECIFEVFNPIELPSDEEIDYYIEQLPYRRDLPLNVKDGVRNGAKWMKEQITNKTK